MDEVFDAIVDEIVLNGKHGPYAVAQSESFRRPITFLLKPPVWEEDQLPELGTYVVLSKLTKKRAGWRAQHGRFFKPDDEKKGEESNENKEK